MWLKTIKSKSFNTEMEVNSKAESSDRVTVSLSQLMALSTKVIGRMIKEKERANRSMLMATSTKAHGRMISMRDKETLLRSRVTSIMEILRMV